MITIKEYAKLAKISIQEAEMVFAGAAKNTKRRVIPQRKSKYNNKKTEVDGIIFHSKKEAARYCVLKLFEKNGEISELVLQPKFELTPKFQRGGIKYNASNYIADFQYKKEGITIVEDVKGYKTALYKQKVKTLLWRYPHINFIET